MSLPRIGAVVLAAGASTRLGEPKQLVVLGGETLLERAVRTARAAGCAPVVVVLGAAAKEIEAGCDLGDAVVRVNAEWREGMASSIRLAVGESADGSEGVLVMTCDQPAVTVAHLALLMGGNEVRASRYAGRNGVPAYFPKKHFKDLVTLKGDAGARTLLAEARAEDLLHGELDIDTAEDLARARDLFS